MFVIELWYNELWISTTMNMQLAKFHNIVSEVTGE